MDKATVWMSKLLLLTLLLTTAAWCQELGGWRFVSNPGTAYRGFLDRQVAYQGNASASIRSLPLAFSRSSGLYWQAIDASSYRGQRIRLEGFVRSQEVTGWAGLWLRLDPKEGPPLEFDNMQNRPILGTTPWKPYSIELNVAPEAEEIHLGALLVGQGQIWIDELRLNRLGRFLPGYDEWRRARHLPKDPVNLNFEDD